MTRAATAAALFLLGTGLATACTEGSSAGVYGAPPMGGGGASADADGDGDSSCTSEQKTACAVDVESDDVTPTELSLCLRELDPAHPGSGLYAVCLVSPEGAIYLTVLGGTTVVETPGWTHSAYGGGLFPSTLSSTDEARCQEAANLQLAAVKSDTGACPGLPTP